jgi:hypothetical protein
VTQVNTSAEAVPLLEIELVIAAAKARLDPAAFDAVWIAGQSTSPDQSSAYAADTM